MRKTIKKAQKGYKATADSSKYYRDESDFQWKQAQTAAHFGMRDAAQRHAKKASQASSDEFRQKFKGQPGFDANGFPLKKQKNGGKTKAKTGAKIKKAQAGKILKKGIKKGIETVSAMRKTPIKEMFQGVGKGITKYQGKDAYGKDIFEKPSNKVKDLFKGFGKGIKDYKEPGKYKKGGKVMLKRADGSYSQRGLWDNIRAKRGSGKKPTAAMLKQERKIKAKSKKK